MQVRATAAPLAPRCDAGVGWEHCCPLLFPGASGKDCSLSCSGKASRCFCMSREKPRIICSVQLPLARHLLQPFALQHLWCGSRKERPNAMCSSPDTDKEISKAPAMGWGIVASLVCATHTMDFQHSSEWCFLLAKSLLW